MTKKAHCQACTFMIYGVKTRKSIPHTCGKTDKELRELKKQVKNNEYNNSNMGSDSSN